MEKILSFNMSEDDELRENISLNESLFDSADITLESPRKCIGNEMTIKCKSNPFKMNEV
mgnify:CR=1 FL=1